VNRKADVETATARLSFPAGRGAPESSSWASFVREGRGGSSDDAKRRYVGFSKKNESRPGFDRALSVVCNPEQTKRAPYHGQLGKADRKVAQAKGGQGLSLHLLSRGSLVGSGHPKRGWEERKDEKKSRPEAELFQIAMPYRGVIVEKWTCCVAKKKKAGTKFQVGYIARDPNGSQSRGWRAGACVPRTNAVFRGRAKAACRPLWKPAPSHRRLLSDLLSQLLSSRALYGNAFRSTAGRKLIY